MQPYQFSYPEQSQIYRRLDALVGQGAAAFYKDACRLMAMDDPLESTTHLVGHLLREIESSLRSVLKPISERIDSKKSSGNENHKNEILAVLRTLEIPGTDAAVETWLKLVGKGEDGLHKRAHRKDLAPPRILDEDFKDFWRQMNELLDVVLDRFETRAAAIRARLDQLLIKPELTKQDIDFLRLNTPNSNFALGYFFDRLESPAWLKQLHEAGFFNNPPGVETDVEAKTSRFPIWAQSRYLIKVAPHEPEIVLLIATELLASSSDNILIYEDLAEAALKMPSTFAARWVEQAIIWLKQQTHLYFRLPDTLGELVTYLTRENQVDAAIRLAQELLAVLPQQDSPSIGKPKIRFEEYYYDRVIKEHLQLLIEYEPDLVLALFCDLLIRCLNLSYSTRERRFSEDYSSSWSPTLDSSSENLHRVDSILAGAIWDVTRQIAERDLNQARNLFQKFQGYRWRIFDRISLHLLRRFPEQVSDLIINRLTDRDRLEWLGLYLERMGIFHYSHEHALLLKEQFKNLPVDAQEQIFRWLLEDPVDVMKIEADKREAYVKHWRRDWFSIISDYLPPHLKQLYNQLVQELGSATSLDSIFTNTESIDWSGLNSPKLGAELAEMAESDMNALFTYLREWQPSGKLGKPSINDLAWKLADTVITPNPQKFVNQIERLKELDPQFMVWLLRGLKTALDKPPDEQSAFSWEPVLAFCAWMVENLRDICEHPASDGYSEWSRICDAIVELIDAGLLAKGASSIPLTLRKQVWQLLKPLTNDPKVTPGFTPYYQGTSMGTYGASINTVRGKAMHAVVRYAFWVRQDANGNAAASNDFQDLPEVQQVLEQHLDPQQDPSLVIHAVYGKWFPLLFHLASDWTFQHIDQIFPEDPVFQGLFEAAWEGYVPFNRIYTNVFSSLRKKYSHVVEQLPGKNPASREQSEADKALSNHLLNLLWYEVIDLDEPDSLLERFFANASAYPREEFIRQVGQRLLYDKLEVNDDLCQRLQKLLEWRITQAKGPTFSVEQVSDLKYFSWWFASGKLDDQWAIARLVDVLKLLGTVNHCSQFLERLESLSFTMPQDAVQCLCLMADGSKALEWFVSYRSDHHRAILQAALESGDEVAQKAAEVLINRLLVRNLGDYQVLLS